MRYGSGFGARLSTDMVMIAGLVLTLAMFVYMF
jgi:hypothetical protein